MAASSISDLSSEERQRTLYDLLQNVVLPQRARLLRVADHTWQSAYVDDDGYLAELIASIVLGVPGNNRKGVAVDSGDLSDGTEVKKGYRLDPNIDLILRGTVQKAGKNWLLALEEIPDVLKIAPVQTQINANACSVQEVIDVNGVPTGGRMWRTASSGSLSGGAGGGWFLKFSRRSHPESPNEQLTVCVRQERGHVNFGNRTKAELDAILSSHPVLVFYQHDRRGAFSLAVTQIRMSDAEKKTYLDGIYSDSVNPRQVQPYLYPDNQRDVLAPASAHSVAEMGGSLLAYAVVRKNGLELLHWDPTGKERVKAKASLLTALAEEEIAPALRHDYEYLDWANEKVRQEEAHRFFDECIVGYNRGLQPYCELASVTRNIGLGNLSQHLASICTGIRGTRSGARGGDLIEADLSTLSEVKLATGERGDAMGTEDMPRLTLGWDQGKMLKWKRLIAVRFVELGSPGDGKWHARVHAPNHQEMQAFKKQVKEYFHGRVNNGSGGLQYHAKPYPHDDYGTKDHTLSFVPIAEFEEGKPPKFRKMPDW